MSHPLIRLQKLSDHASPALSRLAKLLFHAGLMDDAFGLPYNTNDPMGEDNHPHELHAPLLHALRQDLKHGEPEALLDLPKLVDLHRGALSDYMNRKGYRVRMGNPGLGMPHKIWHPSMEDREAAIHPGFTTPEFAEGGDVEHQHTDPYGNPLPTSQKGPSITGNASVIYPHAGGATVPAAAFRPVVLMHAVHRMLKDALGMGAVQPPIEGPMQEGQERPGAEHPERPGGGYALNHLLRSFGHDMDPGRGPHLQRGDDLDMHHREARHVGDHLSGMHDEANSWLEYAERAGTGHDPFTLQMRRLVGKLRDLQRGNDSRIEAHAAHQAMLEGHPPQVGVERSEHPTTGRPPIPAYESGLPPLESSGEHIEPGLNPHLASQPAAHERSLHPIMALVEGMKHMSDLRAVLKKHLNEQVTPEEHEQRRAAMQGNMRNRNRRMHLDQITQRRATAANTLTEALHDRMRTARQQTYHQRRGEEDTTEHGAIVGEGTPRQDEGTLHLKKEGTPLRNFRGMVHTQ